MLICRSRSVSRWTSFVTFESISKFTRQVNDTSEKSLIWVASNDTNFPKTQSPIINTCDDPRHRRIEIFRPETAGRALSSISQISRLSRLLDRSLPITRRTLSPTWQLARCHISSFEFWQIGDVWTWVDVTFLVNSQVTTRNTTRSTAFWFLRSFQSELFLVCRKLIRLRVFLHVSCTVKFASSMRKRDPSSYQDYTSKW